MPSSRSAACSSHADRQPCFQSGGVGLPRQVAFVEHADRALALAQAQDRLVRFVQRARQVEHGEHEARAVARLPGAVHADLFHHIVCGMNAGRISQMQHQVAQTHGLLHHIARGTGDGGHN